MHKNNTNNNTMTQHFNYVQAFYSLGYICKWDNDNSRQT